MFRRPFASLLLASTTSATSLRAVDAPPARVATRAGIAAAPPEVSASARRRPTLGRFYLALAGLALGLAALSLLAPSTPSYDPWSWTLWAREIVHGQLVITDTGTSWKPLPMLFTIPFALVGRAVAPDLWLVVARAGAIAAVIVAFRLAYRLTRALGDDGDRRLLARAPAVLAGLIALVALGFAAQGSYITSNGLGYSEALAAALLLAAIDCHLDGRHRATFAIGFLVALDRPEIWLFWVPYGLWLGRRDPAMRAWIAIAFVLQPIAWFVPVYLGSGQLGSSVTRATHPRSNSLAFAGDPFWAELSRAAWPTMMLRVKIMAALVVLGTGVAAWRRRAARLRDTGGATTAVGGLAPRTRTRTRALTTAAVLGLGGLAWFVVIAVMTEIGFSGNDRYLVLGAALVDVCGAVGFGWLALTVGRAVESLRGRRTASAHGATPGHRRAVAVGTGAALGTLVAAAVFTLAPAWIVTQDFVSLPKAHRALLYQARLRQSLPRAIALAGGRRAVLACGTVMAEGFQVPMVAYALDVPTTRVLAPPTPGATVGPAPNTVLQTRDTQSAREMPMIRDWSSTRFTHRGAAGPWHTFTHCATGS